MSKSSSGAPPVPELVLIGDNHTRIWGLTNAQRIEKMARAAGLKIVAQGTPSANVLYVNLAYAFDPAWFRHILANERSALLHRGDFILAHLAAGDKYAPQKGNAPADYKVFDYAERPLIYNRQLRKFECPFVEPINDGNKQHIQRLYYNGSYKGITDVLTKYLWPELAFHLTRLAAFLRMTPNMVTAIGAALCILATILFAQGMFWTGMLAGFVFMVLDTVDGKLARCTITSSWWGNIFDHGIDLVHPPFWWVAWAMGTAATAHPLSSELLTFSLAAILAGYVIQRVIEGIFIRAFGFHIHVWRKIDSDFRLITARRNPNMVILFVSLLFARPDLGLVAVAIWTILSLLVHMLQIVQAYMSRARGVEPRSWLEQSAS